VYARVAVAAYIEAGLGIRSGRFTNLFDALMQADYTDTYGVRLKFYQDGTRLAYFNITNLQDGVFQSIGQWTSDDGGKVSST
jgi:hypothetical protein